MQLAGWGMPREWGTLYAPPRLGSGGDHEGREGGGAKREAEVDGERTHPLLALGER